jgi:hypothetical protein
MARLVLAVVACLLLSSAAAEVSYTMGLDELKKVGQRAKERRKKRLSSSLPFLSSSFVSSAHPPSSHSAHVTQPFPLTLSRYLEEVVGAIMPMAIVFEDADSDTEVVEKLAEELDLLARVAVVNLEDADDKLLERLVSPRGSRSTKKGLHMRIDTLIFSVFCGLFSTDSPTLRQRLQCHKYIPVSLVFLIYDKEKEHYPSFCSSAFHLLSSLPLSLSLILTVLSLSRPFHISAQDVKRGSAPRIRVLEYGPAPKKEQDVETVEAAVAHIKATLPQDLVASISSEAEIQPQLIGAMQDKKICMFIWTGVFVVKTACRQKCAPGS